MAATDEAILSRGNEYKVDASQIICDHSYNSRIKQIPQEKIESLAISIIEHSQLQPVVLRREKIDGENKLRVVAGYTRVEAVRFINSSPSLLELIDDKRLSNGVLPLLARIQQYTDNEAFINSIIENNERNATTPVDDAHNQQKLRNMGYKDKDIAKIYGVSAPQISLTKRVLELSESHQMLLHDGKISFNFAIRLSDLEEDERDNFINKSLDSNNDSPKKGVIKEVKEKQREKGVKVGRTFKELKDFFSMCSMPGAVFSDDKASNDKFKRIMDAMRLFAIGEASEDNTIEAVMKEI